MLLPCIIRKSSFPGKPGTLNILQALYVIPDNDPNLVEVVFTTEETNLRFFVTNTDFEQAYQSVSLKNMNTTHKEPSTLDKVKEAPPDAKFFWRDWRNYCADTGHLYLVEAREQNLVMGEIVGFLNYEHAIVEFCDEFDGVFPTQIVDLTIPGVTLFKEKALAEQFIKVLNE